MHGDGDHDARQPLWLQVNSRLDIGYSWTSSGAPKNVDQGTKPGQDPVSTIDGRSLHEVDIEASSLNKDGFNHWTKQALGPAMESFDALHPHHGGHGSFHGCVSMRHRRQRKLTPWPDLFLYGFGLLAISRKSNAADVLTGSACQCFPSSSRSEPGYRQTRSNRPQACCLPSMRLPRWRSPPSWGSSRTGPKRAGYHIWPD